MHQNVAWEKQQVLQASAIENLSKHMGKMDDRKLEDVGAMLESDFADCLQRFKAFLGTSMIESIQQKLAKALNKAVNDKKFTIDDDGRYALRCRIQNVSLAGANMQHAHLFIGNSKRYSVGWCLKQVIAVPGIVIHRLLVHGIDNMLCNNGDHFVARHMPKTLLSMLLPCTMCSCAQRYEIQQKQMLYVIDIDVAFAPKQAIIPNSAVPVICDE